MAAAQVPLQSDGKSEVQVHETKNASFRVHRGHRWHTSLYRALTIYRDCVQSVEFEKRIARTDVARGPHLYL